MINSIFNFAQTLLDKIIPDKKDRDKAQFALEQLQQNGELSIVAKQSDVLVAEAKSESILARNWRPLIMILFGIIIANNYILAPWLCAFGLKHTSLPIPPDMWQLLKIGLGGYIVGRSVEKGISAWKRN